MCSRFMVAKLVNKSHIFFFLGGGVISWLVNGNYKPTKISLGRVPACVTTQLLRKSMDPWGIFLIWTYDPTIGLW